MKYQTATKSQLWNLVNNLQKQLADTQETLYLRNLDLVREEEKVEELEETVSIQKTLISSLEEDLQTKDGITYKQEKEIDSLQNTIDMQHKELVSVTKENEELREEAALLRNTAQKNGNEITDLKDQIKCAKGAEKAAWRQVEKANQRTTDLRDQNNNYEDRIADAKEICWTLYDSLLTEEEVKSDMITNLRLVIGFLHD
jgi:chromosome segregation ATPase